MALSSPFASPPRASGGGGNKIEIPLWFRGRLLELC